MASIISGSYFIDERLTTAYNPYNSHTTRRLILREGNTVLTIGWGITTLESEITKIVGVHGSVTAIPTTNEQLAITKERMQKVKTLTPALLDFLKIDTITQQFDRIHCRFVLSHLPWNVAETTISKLLAKLKPCGRLIIEEFQSSEGNTTEKIKTFLTSEPFRYNVSYTTYQPVPSQPAIRSRISNEVAQIYLTKYA